MQVVIDIPEKVYNALIHTEFDASLVVNEMRKSIVHGTPLPKGHGDLKDADALKKHKYHDGNRFENAVSVAQIDWADTIIEADKADDTIPNEGSNHEFSDSIAKAAKDMFGINLKKGV